MTSERDTSVGIQPNEALSTVERLVAAGVRRGLYSRWVAVLVALWTGGFVFLFASGSRWQLPYMLVGFVVWFLRTRRTGAVYREVASGRDLVIVLATAVVFLGIMIVGHAMRRDYGVNAAPWIAGAIVAFFLYLIMELSYGKVWAEIARTKA